jgi:hypothetical protein
MLLCNSHENGNLVFSLMGVTVEDPSVWFCRNSNLPICSKNEGKYEVC